MKEFAKESVQMTLIGNKIDLSSQRKVKIEEAKQLAMAYNISYMETSAKTGQNVQEAFHALAKWDKNPNSKVFSILDAW